MEELYREANNRWMDAIRSNDPQMQKKAADAMSDYVPAKLREDSFFHRIIPLQPAGKLDRSLTTDKPFKIIDVEPHIAPAVTLPFRTQAEGQYIRGRKIGVSFDEISSPRFSKDINELHTYEMDIRQVVSDDAIKDLSLQIDGKFIQACRTIAGSTPNSDSPVTGRVQYTALSGGLARSTVPEAKKTMMGLDARLTPQVALCSFITAVDFEKWDRIEWGGDIAQDVAEKGWTERNMFGVKWIISIKTELLPTGEVWYFAAPRWLGRAYVLQDVAMWVKREMNMLEMQAYGTFGGCIANAYAVTRHIFN